VAKVGSEGSQALPEAFLRSICEVLMSKANRKYRAQFQGEEFSVTKGDMLISNALAIQALEAFLVDKGLLKPGELEMAVTRLLVGQPALEEKRLIVT
jgi:hypothetical protein